MFLLACAPPTPETGCVVDGGVACAHETTWVSDGLGDREVYWQAPQGTGPFPVAIGFQGSLFSADLSWRAAQGDVFGADHQAEVTMALLDAGFIVITPEAAGSGTTCWNTNVPPWAGNWDLAPDNTLMTNLFDGIDAGDFGDADGRRYAYGISSGGYMTSRMSDYSGRFSALVVVAASWETCAGLLCVLPEALPADHPPTRFVHGSGDLIVPIGTSAMYADALDDIGVENDRITHDGGHEWPEDSAGRITEWFLAH